MRYLIFILITLISSSLFPSNILASEVTRLSPSEGLSQSYVNTLVIDNKGYLWLSTEGGLNRYDGYQVLRVKGPQGELEEVMIDRIYQDPLNRIWIASRRLGLYSYDPEHDKYQKYLEVAQSQEEMLEQSVNQMLSKSDTQLWLGRGDNVALLDISTGKVSIEVHLPIDKQSGHVRKLLRKNEYLFIATSEGAFVYHLDSKILKRITHVDTPEHNLQLHTKSFALQGENTLLIGAVNGLYQVDISQLGDLTDENYQWENQHLIKELNIWKIVVKPNSLLLGTDKGLMHFNTIDGVLTRDERISKSRYTLTDNSIIDFLEDKYGALWVATKRDGAFYIPKRKTHFHNVNNGSVKGTGFSHSTVWSLLEYKGVIWASTNDGLTSYDLSTNETKTYLKGYMGEAVMPEFSISRSYLYKDKIWLESSRGLFVFDPNTYEVSRPQVQTAAHQKVIEDYLYGMLLMPNGRLYFIHPSEGFYYYDIDNKELKQLEGDIAARNPFLSYAFLAPLPDEPSYPLYYSGGVLYRLNPETSELTEIYAVPDANENLPVSLLTYTVDKNNVLWLAFSNFGLVGLSLDGFEVIHTIDLKKLNLGTPMYGMHQDRADMIWMSSHKGIWRLDPDNLHLQQFTTKDGLFTNEFNGGSSIKLSDGRVVYGSLKGFTIFSPRENRPKQPLLSRINITSVELMSRKLHSYGLKTFGDIVLNHDDIGLEVAFSAMVFNYQQSIVYEYQISGSQKILTRGNNRVTFPKLNPGNYQLKVWAKDPLTGDYTQPAKLNIRVRYPMWRSPIALAIYLMLVLFIFGLWLYRKSRIEQMIIAAHKETQNSEARLKLALESSGSGVWDWHLHSQLIYQPRLFSELEYAQNNICLDDYLQLIHPSDRAIFRLEWLEFVSTNKGVFDCTYRLKHAKGHWRWYKDFGKVMAWQEGTPERVTGTYTNLTRERMFEERARLFGAAFEKTRDWVFILDKNLRIQACNTALQQAFNIEAEPKSSTNLHLGLSRQTRMRYLRRMTDLKMGEHISAEDQLILANSQICHVLIKISAVEGVNGELHNYVVVLTDISSQKRTEQELYQLANYDTLTGLPNKALFIDRTEHAIEQMYGTQPVAVLAIKFKRLQHYQDSYDSDFYDVLIKQLANTLKCCFRDHDSLAIGVSQEFYVLMEQIEDISQITRYINCLMNRFEPPVKVLEHSCNIQLSIGVAMYPEDALNAFTLSDRAKIALNHAMKHYGNHYQFYQTELNLQVQKGIEISKMLELANQRNEFCNLYQPIINGTSKVIDGFEVMLHWPTDALYRRDELTDAAEQSGLISELMLQTLERALIELKQWHLFAPQLYISVNLSPLDFQYPELISKIGDTLKRTQVDGKHVVFEISEPVMMTDIPHALERMYQLKVLGCRLFMDDFGTSYASLTYLKKLPVDVLKIDKGFIQDIGVDNEHEVIIHSILSLAHSLGIQCIADGIENKTQMKFLRLLGCDYFQGSHFSEPILGEKIADLLTLTWQHRF
ncbi:EAL domain-containing protein [Pseudoalteromonas sp. MMG013]|uniref:EAL domain-containing protein n=1 Tax=Pseudoalteromonas sp. MMG013 TaxID=2822687 RepID=UPI001B36896C|nr:EAL domain-containing protein [Pseudoalteromonas sp. MMG013]MBQ4861650.1 EAL domain-containing protein [Pseudoalteromonas sp. MMG013]